MKEKKEVVCLLGKVLEEKNISKYEFSKMLGINNQYVYQFVTKENYNPKIANALKIASVLGLSIDDIWKEKNNQL